MRGSGIIPANTGKIYRGDAACPGCADHPREYGENDISAGFVAGGTGSSPRIRGKSPGAWESRAGCRIIPANTGKMTCGRPPPRLRRDHPREYGENAGTVDGCGCGIGSSPRIRGKFVVDAGMGKGGGIIPANTGKIFCVQDRLPRLWDHPREYGENFTYRRMLCG